MPANSGSGRRYIRHTDATTWPVLRRRTSRSGAEGRHVVRRTSQRDEDGERRERERGPRPGCSSRRRSRSEPVATMPQNALVAWVPNRPLAGTAYAVSTPSVVGPGERSGPLVLGVRAGRAVVEALLALAPAAGVVEPRVGGADGAGVGGHEGDRGPHVGTGARVSSQPNALLARAAQAEGGVVVVGVRAGSRVHHRVGAVDDLELDVAPAARSRRPRAGCSRPGWAPGSRAVAASDASNSTWIISQSLSCLLVKSLNG